MKRWLVFFTPSYAKNLVYMMQSTEYQVGPYLSWWWRTRDFSKVTYRRDLKLTKAARMLLFALYAGITLYIAVAVWLIIIGIWISGVLIIVLYPLIWAHLLALPVWLGRIFISSPAEKRAIKESEAIFANQAKKSLIVAVAGSYGKTSMKELLSNVLSAHLNVAATPANYNVAISHARFARKLTGQEDVVIIEYGEGAPGDVERFTKTTHPSHAIITGIAPAHLDHYKTLDNAANDIMYVAYAVSKEHVYINADSSYVKSHYGKENFQTYSSKEALGWNISDVKIDISGTSFKMQRGSTTIKLKSGLLGRHNIGPLACVAGLAFDFGMSAPQIIEAIAATKPHEHRMQPYQLGGAWVIDDTYNGNIEGIKAGTKLLSELDARRKIYITPGLVDQGEETAAVHIEMGKLIASAKPDLVVLMCNSVTTHILEGLTSSDFQGEVQIQDDPLDFYSNLAHFVAAGDLVVMQNDWTDNYK